MVLEHPLRLEQSLSSQDCPQQGTVPPRCPPIQLEVKGGLQQLSHIQQLCLQEALEFWGIRRKRNIGVFLLLHLSSPFLSFPFIPHFPPYTQSPLHLAALNLFQFKDIRTKQSFFGEMDFSWFLAKDDLSIPHFLGLPSNSSASFPPDLSLVRRVFHSLLDHGSKVIGARFS